MSCCGLDLICIGIGISYTSSLGKRADRRQCQNEIKMEFMINREKNTKPENDEHLTNAKPARASRIIHFTVMRPKRPTATTINKRKMN